MCFSLMPPRVTRSSARLAAETSSTASDEQIIAAPLAPPPIPSRRSSTAGRKRKAGQTEPQQLEEAQSSRKSKKAKASELETTSTSTTTNNRAKRAKKSTAAQPPAAMSTGYDDGENTRRHSSSRRRQPSPPGTSSETSPQSMLDTGSTRRRSSRKKSAQGAPSVTPSGNNTSAARKSRKSHSKKERSTSRNAQHDEDNGAPAMDNDEEAERDEDKSEDDRAVRREEDRMDTDDPFTNPFHRGDGSGLSNTLRALSGMMSGMSGRLRTILEQLKTKEDPSVQFIALTELSEILLVSNEDNLAGHFSPDAFVRELVTLMQPSDFGEENPEMMLLACRCIANLMEAVPGATPSVVYGGAVPVLCQKLLEIHFIDLAEQALSTLEKISAEFPASIVREGGLTACLTYLDFFATSTQRTAVTTAANCCRNLTDESFPVVRDVMPTLLNVLSSNDQKVVEQGSICVCRIVESFRWQESKLEELVSADLLRAITRLLLPGSTNMIGASIHTQFLRVLAIIARASPRLSVELLRMNVVDTLYQILTGVSPPSGTDEVVNKIDKNIIMQSLIRTPKDQIYETLNVICELLPSVHRDSLMFLDDLEDAGYTGSGSASMGTRARASPDDKRVSLLADCKDEVKRFAIVLFPTLMHAYTSTVNLNVRQKVLTAHLKMLSNLEIPVLEDALRGVPYASHLASIMSQDENPMLVTFALQISELLLKRLDKHYRSQFYREGVMAEITKLSSRPLIAVSKQAATQEPSSETKDPEKAATEAAEKQRQKSQRAYPDEDGSEDDDPDDHVDDDEDDEDDEDDDNAPGHASRIEVSVSDIQDLITQRAQKFMGTYGKRQDDSAEEATKAVSDLRTIAQKIRACYGSDETSNGSELFKQLCKYFYGDAPEGITSYEMLTSGILDALLDVFSSDNVKSSSHARSAFLQAFMSEDKQSTTMTDNAETPATAFSVLVHKLQDLLSRTEHFEVVTVNSHGFETNRSSAASMLAKQLRLKLAAGDDSGIPDGFRNIMVSIHAIATFRALDDYLRPRIAAAERSHRLTHRESALGGALAALTTEQNERSARDSAPPTPSLSAADSAAPASKNKKSVATATTSTKKDTPTGQLRRSSRRLSGKTTEGQASPQAAARGVAQEGNDNLECANETHVPDAEEDDDMGAGEDDEEMEQILDEFEEAMDEDEEDPSAVNLEYADSGKVTARKEDGTRVATPLQGSQGSQVSQSALSRLSASARLAAARELLSTPTGAARASSYAAAVQATPQDWHLEFSVNGQTIPNDTTIYRAVHFSQTQPEETSNRLIWQTLHKISFKRVDGPPPAGSSAPTPPPESQADAQTGLPPSLSQHPQTAGILRLMSILHSMNDNLEDVVSPDEQSAKLSPEPVAQFVNTKLTAKLNRQLEEPLIVASNCLPSWAEDLARLYPFLFPFETRHLFLQSTSFGYSRSMARWQTGQHESTSRRGREERTFLGRVQRQKVRISRVRILESALRVMDLYGTSPSILEVEYFDEVGTGLGPTLEFYSKVSREFAKKKLKLWRENESEPQAQFAFGKRGLFPAPMSEDQATTETGRRILYIFSCLGKFVARSMLDSRIIDISFNPTFFRIGDTQDQVPPSLGAVATVDQNLASSLKDLMQAVHAKRSIDNDAALSAEQKKDAYKHIDIKGAAVEDLGLDFTLPGYPSIELESNGAQTDVTIENLERYIEKVIDFTLGSGVKQQIDAFRTGFSQVFPHSALKAFTPDELVMLFGQTEEDWSLETLMDAVKADHGFNIDSQTVRNLLQTMSEYGEADRRDFLQFVSGSPKLPIGGKFLPHSPYQNIKLTEFYRLQVTHPNVHRRLQTGRATTYIRRLSTKCHDLRQLPQIAKLQ